MKKFNLLILAALMLTAAATATAQDRLLIGITRNGGTVFQTMVHRGRSNIRSEMTADGIGSRTESHSRFDDGDDLPAPTPRPQVTVDRQPEAQQPVEAPTAPERKPESKSESNGPQKNADGGHLICILQSDGNWKACGVTPDQTKAQHAVQILRQQQIEARVFQFLPLPAEAAKLLPIENAIGLAVRLTGEVYAVAKDGRLVEVLMPTNSASE